MFDKKQFGDDFKWGVSTAAYQIEGAHESDGKGTSIWDTFSNKSKKIFKDHNGNHACDFYNRYRDDLQLMKYLNIPNFRFSLAWSRILPNGTGQPNQKGMDFLLEIEPQISSMDQTFKSLSPEEAQLASDMLDKLRG